MKYKEFQTGILTTGVAIQRLFEETCAEYSILAMDIANRSASTMRLENIGGWVNRAAYDLPGFVANITVDRSEYASNFSGDAQSNAAMGTIRLENIATSPSGTIVANAQGSVVMKIDDIQIIYCGTERSAIGNAEVFGILKGSIEGISTTFDTGNITNAAPSAWIDCRAYSTMSFEVWNSGGGALTGLTATKRRHANNISTNTIAFTFADFFNTNPVAIIQQVRAATPNAGTATGRSVIDINVNDLHSLQFNVSSGQCRIRGVLKG